MITGRPARQALDLGGLEEVGTDIEKAGKDLYLFGQYGNERWSSTSARRRSAAARRAGDVRARAAPGARGPMRASAYIEDKGLAVAVHTRRLDDADGAFDRLLPSCATWPRATTSWSSRDAA